MAEQTMTKKKGLKKGWRIVLGILAGLILLYAVLGVLPRRENYALANPMMKEGALPLLIAHGGGNKEFPDNTLEAFYNAYSVDKNAMMETDVSITRDGVVILSHDTTLDRKTNVTGRIIDVCCHRLVLSAKARLHRLSAADITAEIVKTVKMPQVQEK